MAESSSRIEDLGGKLASTLNLRSHASLCSICTSLDLEYNFQVGGTQLSKDQYHSKVAVIGSFNEVMKRQDCIFCKWLIQCLITCEPKKFATRSESQELPIKISFEREHDFDKQSWYTIGRIRIRRTGTRWEDIAELRVTSATKPRKTPGSTLFTFNQNNSTGKLYGPVEPFQTAVSLIKHWLSTCDKVHGRCKGHAAAPRPHTIRCVDVVSRKITGILAHEDYIALSYVLGTCSVPSIGTDGVIEKVPSTIEDAIKLTEALGYRYLWVDALCIHNDDQGSRLVEIQRMDQIYLHATVVIAAASGKDANSGLAGLTKAVHSYQSFSFSSTIVHCRGLAESTPTLASLEPWNSRCWTLQEALFAKRLIIFTLDEILFECGQSEYRERLGTTEVSSSGSLFADLQLWKPYDETRTHLNIQDGVNGATSSTSDDYFRERWLQDGFDTSKNNFDLYARLVHRYLSRDLTYEYDIVNAFQGLANVVARRNGEKTCWTFPRSLLLWGMTWVPVTKSGHQCNWCGRTNRPTPWQSMRRRQNVPGRCPFPSWFWGGWMLENAAYVNCMSTGSEYGNQALQARQLLVGWPEEDWLLIEETGIVNLDVEIVNIDLRSQPCSWSSDFYLEDGGEKSWAEKTCSFISVPCWKETIRNGKVALAVVWKNEIAYRVGHIVVQTRQWEAALPVQTRIKLG